jgi:hypothetical protein
LLPTVALEPGKSFHVFPNDAPIDGVGIDRFVAMMEFADLEAFVSPFRKPVEYSRFRTIEDEHRKYSRCELRPRRFEPTDDLAVPGLPDGFQPLEQPWLSTPRPLG